MKAGIDFGTTLVKVVWKHENNYTFLSTAKQPLEEIIKELKKEGIKQLNIVGIKSRNIHRITGLADFELIAPKGDLITNEIELQANGLKKLLELENIPTDKFLIVSIGTGTSYTFVDKFNIKRFPLGNSIGGGYIRGIGELFGTKNYQEMVEHAVGGKILDYCIKDAIPEKEGTFEGELVIANFGKADSKSKNKDIYASTINCVVVSTIRDIMLIDMIPDFKVPDDIIYIGSTLSNNQLLKELLIKYSQMIGKKPEFPFYGEYALAIGAYHHND